MATDRHTFIGHLEQLRDSIDKTQPLAELPGNILAIAALVALDYAAKQIREDIDGLWSKEKSA